MTRAIYDAAHAYLGLEEWPGARHNPAIVEFAKTVGHGWVQDDETPWCASFVGAVLSQLGLPHTGRLNARSYLDWGDEVPLERAHRGDIVVFWRGSRDGWKGHVGFYEGVDRQGNILVLGGNQGNRVSIAPYSRERLLSVRRLRQARTSLAQTRTQRGASVAAVSTVGATAADVAQGVLAEADATLRPFVQALPAVEHLLLAVALGSIALVAYARWDDWRAGWKGKP